jgi:SAM-dependent methyltransferase
VTSVVCPRDRGALEPSGRELVCAEGHAYPFADGVPVLLVDEAEPTHAACGRSLARARRGELPTVEPAPGIDPWVQGDILDTHGNLYRHLVGRLPRYPIPALRLPPGEGRTLLDVGCNWGRWSVAAARLGYRPLGLDPSLPAVLAARRVASELGADAEFVVGDARHLPLPDASVDVVFSYSVFHHFSRDDALRALAEIRRVVKPGGRTLVQMASAFGPRNLVRQLRRRRFREQTFPFDVRYWTPRELLSAFEETIGPTRISVDGYFALNVQPTDADLLPRRYRAVVRASERLRALSERLPALAYAADSLYLESRP